MYKNPKIKKTPLDQITPDVLGIIWLTRDPLDRDLIEFDVFNYLFDGLISEFLYGQANDVQRNSNIFFTKQFGEHIFLSHLKTQDLTKSEISSDIDEQIALIKDRTQEKRVILVFDKTNDNWLPELSKRYAQFEFRELE